jgi:hypothetical protein
MMTDPNKMTAEQLNVTVAEEVMEWKGAVHVGLDGSERYLLHEGKNVQGRHFSPATDISAAWEVLQWVRGQDAEVQHQFHMAMARLVDKWRNERSAGLGVDEYGDLLRTSLGKWLLLYADIPAAICLAAVKAVRAMKDRTP